VKALRIVAIVLLVLVIAVLTVSYFFKQHIGHLYAQNAVAAPYDVVIIPGLPYDAPVPNGLFKARMLWSKNLFDKGIVKNIIYSGSAVHTPYIEGKVMKAISARMGIPAQHTFAETRALHTTENVDYCLQLADSLGFKKVAVATDPFQTFFLERHVKKNHLPVALLPFHLDSFKAYERLALPFYDARKVQIPNFVPLKER
jgi:vancomycin permeability regulator SanA